MKIFVPALLLLFCLGATAFAQSVPFDFDNAPPYASLPIDLAAGGVSAHLSATGQGFSIQQAGVLGFTPAGFSGLCIYPNSIYAADLHIDFIPPLTDFSILYAPEEYACDSSALMRVTAYMNGVYVGTDTARASAGTWPSATLAFTSAQSFNSVVVHYDSPPPTGGDWGPIFMADNMVVTPAPVVSAESSPAGSVASVTPNPFAGRTAIEFALGRREPVSVAVFDVKGRLVRVLAAGKNFESGANRIIWDGRDGSGRSVTSGVYLCRVQTGSTIRVSRVVVLREE